MDLNPNQRIYDVLQAMDRGVYRVPSIQRGCAARGNSTASARIECQDNRPWIGAPLAMEGPPASSDNPDVVLEYSVNREQPAGDHGSCLLPGQCVQTRQPPPADGYTGYRNQRSQLATTLLA
jgi:hypothetical protein